MKSFFFASAAALLLAACASVDQRVYERSHVTLSEPVGVECYGQSGAVPKVSRDATYDGKPLKNGGAVFEKGLSVRGSAILVYALDGEKTTFKTYVCMDETSPKDAKAKVTISGNKKVIWEANIRKGSFEEVEQTFKGTEDLTISVEGDSEAVVDFLEPTLEGSVRLRETMIFGRTNYISQCKSDAFQAFPAETRKGVTVFCRASSEYGPLVGASNAYACVMIAPEHHGMLVHYGPDSGHTFGGTMQSFLQPEEEIIPTRNYKALVADPKKWKWRVEEDGAIRVLAAPDLLNGVRRMIVYRLNPRSGEIMIDVMSKNITSHDVMSCLSLVTRFPKGAPVAIEAEKERPGYSLVKGSDEGIVAKEGVVLINQLESWYPLKGPQKLLQKKSGDYLLIRKKGYFQSEAQTPDNGYYPYDGLRLSVYNSPNGVMVTQYGEKLKMTRSQTLHLRVRLDMVDE